MIKRCISIENMLYYLIKYNRYLRLFVALLFVISRFNRSAEFYANNKKSLSHFVEEIKIFVKTSFQKEE